MDPSPTYQERPLTDPSITEVVPDERRRFLVLSGTVAPGGEPWTLVLERQDDYWISRRELAGAVAPETAVSGYLFGRGSEPDPISLLRRMNELVRVEYYRILQDKMKGDRRRSELLAEVSRLKDRIEELRRRPRPRRTRRASRTRRSRLNRRNIRD